ncbi:hypothetical protein [Streptomyces sp. NPDC001759]
MNARAEQATWAATETRLLSSRYAEPLQPGRYRSAALTTACTSEGLVNAPAKRATWAATQTRLLSGRPHPAALTTAPYLGGDW